MKASADIVTPLCSTIKWQLWHKAADIHLGFKTQNKAGGPVARALIYVLISNRLVSFTFV